MKLSLSYFGFKEILSFLVPLNLKQTHQYLTMLHLILYIPLNTITYMIQLISNVQHIDFHAFNLLNSTGWLESVAKQSVRYIGQQFKSLYQQSISSSNSTCFIWLGIQIHVFHQFFLWKTV